MKVSINSFKLSLAMTAALFLSCAADATPLPARSLAEANDNGWDDLTILEADSLIECYTYFDVKITRPDTAPKLKQSMELNKAIVLLVYTHNYNDVFASEYIQKKYWRISSELNSTLPLSGKLKDDLYSDQCHGYISNYQTPAVTLSATNDYID